MIRQTKLELSENPTIPLLNGFSKMVSFSLYRTEKISRRRLVCNPTIKHLVINLYTTRQIGKNKRRLVCNPTIQHIIINLHTKYEYSSLQGSKYGKKENWTNTGKNKRRRLVCNPTIQHVVINLYTKYDFSSLHGCGEMSNEKFHYSKYGVSE